MNNEVICNSYLPGQEFPRIVNSCCLKQLNGDVNVDCKLTVQMVLVPIQNHNKLENIFI